MSEVFSAPPIGTPIDFGSSLAAKLIVSGNAGPSGWWNGAMRCVPTPSGGQIGTGPFGPCRSHVSTSDQLAGIAHGNDLPQDGKCTLMVVYAKRDTTNRASGLLGFNFGSGGARFGAHAPYSDGNIYWDYGGSTNGSSRLTVSGQTWVARAPSVWMYTCGPRGMECWRDGKLVGSNSGTPTRTGAAAYLYLGTHEGGGGDLDDYYTIGIWGRQLEKQEIGLLSKDPWAMYQRPHSLAFQYAAMSGGGGPVARRRQLIVC